MGFNKFFLFVFVYEEKSNLLPIRYHSVAYTTLGYFDGCQRSLAPSGKLVHHPLR